MYRVTFAVRLAQSDQAIAHHTSEAQVRHSRSRTLRVIGTAVVPKATDSVVVTFDRKRFVGEGVALVR